jgi:hypothetical protein
MGFFSDEYSGMWGVMHDDDYDYESGGDCDRYYVSSVKKPKRCNRCGASNLHWERTKEGWRLFNKYGEHSCLKEPQNLKGEE